MYTLVVVEMVPMIYLALGLSLIGLFSKYKFFLLLAVGPIIVMMFEYQTIHEGHTGLDVLIVCLAGWILFNVFVAFTGNKDE